jgi:hypothetical protein
MGVEGLDRFAYARAMSFDAAINNSSSASTTEKTGTFQPKTLLWDGTKFSRKSALWRPYGPEEMEAVLRANFQSFVVRKAKAELKSRGWSREKLATNVSEEFGVKYLGERVRQVFRGDREGRVSEYLLWAQFLGSEILPKWDDPKRAFPPPDQVVVTQPSARHR